MACTTRSFLTRWANNCSKWPTSRNTSCVFSTAGMKTSMPTGRLTRSHVFSLAISIRPSRPARDSLRDCHQFQHVPVRVAKIKTAAAAPIVELAILEAPRRAAEHDLGLFYTAKNGVEFAIGDMEGEVMAVEVALVVEEQGQLLATRHRRELSSADAF